MKKCIALLLITLAITACKKNTEELSPQAEFNIIKKCMARMNQNSATLNYLVSPKFDKFEFNAFLKESKVKEYDYDQKKKQILDSLRWSIQDFNEIQQQTNKKYLNKSNPLLLKLSYSDASHEVISFSGIHKNLVFASIVDYCDTISQAKLALPSFNKKQKFMSAGSIIFILKNGEVQNMILDSGLTLEYQCGGLPDLD
jgi:hypothetical protein